jgi:site-specific DNA-methyltransferase (adenine-specific)
MKCDCGHSFEPVIQYQHRLICGDCTDAAVVARVMGGERIRCVWTDPPYGVSYADKNEFLNALNRGNSNQTAIEHDHMNEADTEKLATCALSLAVAHAEKGASVYVACPAGTLLPHFIAAVAASGFSYKHSLVWVKNQFVIGRCDYHYRHELILYGWIENGAHFFVDDHTKHSVFEIDKPRNSDEHPTMKPVELVTGMIENSARPNAIVYDPFAGSGTTGVACQNLGRRAYMIEISPAYCAVILERFAGIGVTPELVANAVLEGA